MEEGHKQLLRLANENEHVCNILSNIKILLEDYTSANSLPSNEALSRQSKNSSAPIIKGKRKCKKGDVASIIETLQGTKNEEAQVTVLKKVLQHKNIKEIVQNAGFIDSESKRYGAMSSMVENAKIFISRALETHQPQGRPIDDKKSAVKTLQVAMLKNPEGDPNTPSQSGEKQILSTSLRVKANMMNIPFTTFRRNEKKSAKHVLS